MKLRILALGDEDITRWVFNSLTGRGMEVVRFSQLPETIALLKLCFRIYWPEAEVSFVAEGEQGIKLAKSQPMDIILLDLILPDISGLDVLNKIRSFTRIPVIILTADRNQDTLIKAIRSGANDYVLKPFKQTELMNRLRQFINQGATVS